MRVTASPQSVRGAKLVASQSGTPRLQTQLQAVLGVGRPSAEAPCCALRQALRRGLEQRMERGVVLDLQHDLQRGLEWDP